VAGDPYAEEAIYQMFLSRLADLSEETALWLRPDRPGGRRPVLVVVPTKVVDMRRASVTVWG
jgi:hypothetical protein